MEGEDKKREALIKQLSEAHLKIAELEAETRNQDHRINVLGDREERFRTIVEAARDSLIMVNNKGIISYWNPAAEKLFGYRSEEAVGKGLGMIIPKRYRAFFEKGFNIFRKTGQGPAIGRTVESEAINKKGREFPVELSLSAIQIRGEWQAVGLVRDITDRKDLEELMRESIQKYLIMLQNGRDVIILIDFETHKILEVNQAAADLYGYSREELLEMRALDFGADTQMRDVIKKEVTPQTKGDLNILLHRKKDRTIFPAEVSACSFMWKGRKTYCAVVRDISDHIHETDDGGEYIRKISMFG